ncbi:MAG: hypothetical protein HQ519_00145 [Planctomycetes bacterium]|nr:hypothetical protein [Planctomycetota bacterium]
MKTIAEEIKAERQRQLAKFGNQAHLGPFVLLAVLGEEVGEANEAALKMKFEGGKSMDDFREELLQVATVAVQMIGYIDQGDWKGE